MSDDDAEVVVFTTSYAFLQEEAGAFVADILAVDGAVVVEDGEEVVEKGPGKRNAVDGEKARYERTPGRAEANYLSVRVHHNPTMLQNHTGHSVEQFDALFDLVREEISLPMDPRLKWSRDLLQTRQRRSRSIPDVW